MKSESEYLHPKYRLKVLSCYRHFSFVYINALNGASPEPVATITTAWSEL